MGIAQVDKVDFQNEIKMGIPDRLPQHQPLDPSVSHAPKRKDILSSKEKKLAIENALRYFPDAFHSELAPEFYNELKKWDLNAFLDGEIIVANSEGVSDFDDFQNWRSEADGTLIYYVF